jgi:hypothetical protein
VKPVSTISEKHSSWGLFATAFILASLLEIKNFSESGPI